MVRILRKLGGANSEITSEITSAITSEIIIRPDFHLQQSQICLLGIKCNSGFFFTNRPIRV